MTTAAPGNTVVRSRALERVFGILAARRLGVPMRSVNVRVVDERGLLRVEIRGPYADRTLNVVETGATVQDLIRGRGGELTGARIGAVTVRISDVTPTRRRSLG